MTWPQGCDPLGNIVVSTALAALPVVDPGLVLQRRPAHPLDDLTR